MQFMGSIADTLVGAGHDVHIFRVSMNKRAETLPKEVFNVTNFHNFVPNFVQTGKFDINQMDNFKEPFDGKSFNTFLFQTNIIEQFGKITSEICRAEQFDVVLAELYNQCPMALFHRIGVKTKLGTLALPLYQTVVRPFGIPTLSSYVTNLFTPMNGGHKMNFVERFVNFVNDLYDWLYLNNLIASYEEPVIAEAFGQNFPPLKQIMRNVSLLFTNSNQFFEMPRPISNKIINIGGIVEMKVKELEPGIKAIVDNSLDGTVIVSFGTFADINSMKREMKMAFLEAFAHFPNYEFIWKVELSDEDAKLLMHPKIRAFVSHCGFNSVNEAVQFGVPILAIPLLADQLYNAIMARAKGIAVQLDVGELNGEGAEQLLVDGLDKVLNDPSYRQNVKLLKQKFASTPFGAKEKLIRWVEFAAEFHDLNELNLPWEEELGTLAYYSVDIILLIVAIGLCFGRKSDCGFGSFRASTNCPVVEVPDVEASAFKVMLSFIYTEDLSELDGTNAMAVLYASKKYDIPALADRSLQIPISKLRNVFMAYSLAGLYELEKVAYDYLFYIDKNADTLFESEEFLKIDQKILCEILGRDELQINGEISIWNAALRWADAKCRQNGIECSAENRRAMLGPALLKIRFPLLSNEEFSKKIGKRNQFL
ncbi:hypothetical protein niasHS_000022 [Heterodera schachtii]|uniref:glucuronosyltransferase n=1 Tax=Heterodera schachtii TaxID=97005 RepID=A0ABD2KL61_HETSC